MTTGPSVSGKFILRGQAIGFSVLLGIMWFVEIIRLPHLLFHESAEFNWLRVGFRTLVVLIVWFIVNVTTRRLLTRLHELEGFLRMCSWCRKVEHEGDWQSVEAYFSSKFSTETSHGICPACAEQHFDRLKAIKVECVAPSEKS